LWGAFREVDAGAVRGREGTGVGLWRARRFVEMHNGRIWVESKISEGSTFSLTMVSQS